MRDTERGLTQKEPRKFSHSKVESGSELILKLKLCSKISHSKQKKSRTISHAHAIGSAVKRLPHPKPLSKGNKNVTIRQLAGKRILLKKLDSESSKELVLSKLRGGKSVPSTNTKGNAEKVEPVAKINQRRKRRKHKVTKEKVELDEASRLQRRARYLIIKMKLEQNLIDAYSGEVPPGDQGWFCKFCEYKMEILEGMNAHLGTRFSMNISWEDVFKDEAASPDRGNALLNHEEDWPTDDSADDDYNPDKNENDYDNPSGEKYDKDALEESVSSSSLSWSLDGEDLTYKDGIGCEEHFGAGNTIVSDGSSQEAIICGRRRQQAVDYKKLHVEMFGKDAPAQEQVSEDEDWGPTKRSRREKESDAATARTLMFLCENEKKSQNIDVDAEKKLVNSQSRSFFRIPRYAVEKLRQVFADNELPSRDVKENLSKELGLDAEKVSKWFKNARYSALRTRKAEGATQSHSPNKTFDESGLADTKEMAENLESEDASIKELLLKSRNSSPYKKRQHRQTSLVSSNNNKDVDFGDDINLKNLLNNIKTKVKKRVKFVARGGGQDAEVEMERLCKMR